MILPSLLVDFAYGSSLDQSQSARVERAAPSISEYDYSRVPRSASTRDHQAVLPPPIYSPWAITHSLPTPCNVLTRYSPLRSFVVQKRYRESFPEHFFGHPSSRDAE